MNEQTKAIIKSTAPVLKNHGEAITTAMYKILFAKHPEAQILFKDASKDQHKKLAAMVYAYAANIDNLGSLQKGIDKVAKIHVEVKVLPEHYPWVGEALLGAIKEVLGDAATPEVMDAWEEAYGFLAKVFIAREEEMYAGN
ncbi:MAG: Flavohemoprotein (Hemoglobin-like protein) (Flavohemoglobin) (Nitric oxide dioxygenase) (EC [uncultured Sulfurovum sp.]|uniref:Flavohemoprotein (Hemoglobin-like protein) (Flavohemoglobin) (Nitric oxide dioxygenase) (EC) n=1 Tax=uncultured Sulfurovum sp. TaxID=269237 RepID=A0A6S6S0D2_9BACT|nr:MAG: Flavohemoprotein (Hemoglobin-like protein) (Flavohemoglobin) (Nitric oxide dioxygenase) (EC [uncultured Sulfurovum sp.]